MPLLCRAAEGGSWDSRVFKGCLRILDASVSFFRVLSRIFRRIAKGSRCVIVSYKPCSSVLSGFLGVCRVLQGFSGFVGFLEVPPGFLRVVGFRNWGVCGVLATGVGKGNFRVLGFGVPYFNTFCLKGNHYEIKVYTFFPLVT